MAHDPNSAAAVLDMQANPDALARENATLRARLNELERQNVVQGKFAGEAPRYQLNDRCFLDDTVFEAGSIIDFVGEPNRTMVPLNEPAKRAMQAHLDHLIAGAKTKAALRNRPFTGLAAHDVMLADALQEARLDAANQMDQPIEMPVPIGQVPPMPHTREAQAAARRRGPQPKAVVSASAPATRQGPPPVPNGIIGIDSPVARAGGAA